MKKNDVVLLEISELNFPNKGVSYIDEYKITVKNTLPHQKIKARICKKKNLNLEARKEEILEKSPFETNKGCSHFEICGGCSYQTIPYEYEDKLKEEQVLKLFKNADIKDFVFEGIVTAPQKEAYRNKCEFSFGDVEKGGELALGMRKRQSFYEVVTLKDCNIVDSDYLKIISKTLEFFKSKNITFYHKSLHTGVLRHLVVRKGFYTGEILINLVTVSDYGFSDEEFVNALLETKLEGKIVGILHTVNDGIADAVINEGIKLIYGRDYYNDRLFDLKFKISPFSFFQTNTKGAEALYSIVKEYTGEVNNKIIYDLYCGTGTISQVMAEKAKKVYGIEIVSEAIDAAKENAKENGITNCEFIAGDVLKMVDELKEKADLIIVDPPRDGIHPKAILKIIDFNAPEIVYVSCNPVSLVRDLKIFEENGYKTIKVRCLNQFSRTVHVETVVLLEKSNKQM